MRAHPDDAGLDVYCFADIIIPPHQTVKVSAGISYEVPDGYCIFAWDKGSLGSKGIKTLGGVLDSGYRGELFIPIHNLNNEPYLFTKGDKIAQIVIQKVELWEVEEVDELTPTLRGANGFGSTGK